MFESWHESNPEMLIVGGPNGAGKTTLAERYAETFGARYVGADKIAYEINPKDRIFRPNYQLLVQFTKDNHNRRSSNVSSFVV